MAAAKFTLDETHDQLPQLARSNDENIYTLGRTCGYNVVITCLPAGEYDTTVAATLVSRMRLAFQNIRFGLIIGIGGGVPSKKSDIRLGDVVVSNPTGTSGGAVPGKTIDSGCFGSLNQPPRILATRIERNHSISGILSGIFEKNPDTKPEFFRRRDRLHATSEMLR
jgi:hypothetical protein